MELSPFIFAALLFISIIFSGDPYMLSNGLFKNDNFEEKSLNFTNRTRRTVVVLDKTKLWSGGVIPYDFTYVINGKQRRFIRKAMRNWERSTCVQFVPRDEKMHGKYLLFTSTELCRCCYFEQGPSFPYKIINLHSECYYRSTVLHEIGHAIGFLHEHNHPDRDKYVKINFSEVEADEVIEYQKYSYNQVDTLSMPHDQFSIMYYPQYMFFGKNNIVNVSIPVPKNLDSSLSRNGFIIINDELSYGDITATNLMYRCPKCGKTFFEPTGRFGQSTTGSENDPKRCEWIIRAAEGERIVLKVTSLKILQTYHCLTDYLEIRNGHSPDSPVIARYCGEIDETKIIASNHLVVTFVKMSVFPNSFFMAEYETTCEQTVHIFNDTIYNFESPNYPENYSSNKKCQWNFIAPEGYQITIKFNFFALEKSKDCRKDFVKITESNEMNSTVIGIYCDIIDSMHTYSTNNKLHVEFSSDRTIESRGFSATVNSIKT